MTRRLPLFIALFALFGLVCPPRSPAQQPHASTAGPRTVEIQASDSMKFTPVSIEAARGEQLRVVLKDVGTMPKTAMAHNFVLLAQAADPKAFADRSATARDTDFIAPALKHQVIASTGLVGPGETADVTFKAPDKPGHYVFICSFPGHYAVGMRGTLNVR